VPLRICLPGFAPMPAEGLSSTSEFHSPQPSHFPDQRGKLLPQDWQTNWVLFLAKTGNSQIYLF